MCHCFMVGEPTFFVQYTKATLLSHSKGSVKMRGAWFLTIPNLIKFVAWLVVTSLHLVKKSKVQFFKGLSYI